LRSAFAATAIVSYVSVALAYGELYPFSAFSMYARAAGTSASRIVVRDAGGALHEVRRFRVITCEPPRPEACGEPGTYASIPYLDAEAEAWIAAHAGAPGEGEPATLVRRIWRFAEPRGPARATDCALAACRVVR
jgi:hypothetical protein